MGFADSVKKVSEPTVVELEAVLEDGKRAAIKCRPLISVDYFSLGDTGFDAIPILTGQKNPEDLSNEERVKMYSWMRAVVAKACFSVRDIEGDQSVWKPVKCVLEDMDEPVLENGKNKISVRMLEALNGGEIVEVANAIISRTNFSRELPKRKAKS